MSVRNHTFWISAPCVFCSVVCHSNIQSIALNESSVGSLSIDCGFEPCCLYVNIPRRWLRYNASWHHRNHLGLDFSSVPILEFQHMGNYTNYKPGILLKIPFLFSGKKKRLFGCSIIPTIRNRLHGKHSLRWSISGQVWLQPPKCWSEPFCLDIVTFSLSFCIQRKNEMSSLDIMRKNTQTCICF
jgi:hypothetical protein